MFSAASLGIALMGFMGMGTFEAAAPSFVASVVSGALFGMASVFQFGPNEA